MLHEEVAKYRELSGDTNPNTPISRIGGYLDGYEKALEQEPCPDVISREKTCDYIAEFINHEYSTQSECEMVEAMIDGIQHLPPVNPQPCEDAISRQTVNILVDELARAISDERCFMSRGRSTATIMQDILDLPSVNPQPKTGHWIKKEDDTCWWYVCSECEQEPLKNRWNNDDVLSTFCPNCGFRMVEPQESEDKE